MKALAYTLNMRVIVESNFSRPNCGRLGGLALVVNLLNKLSMSSSDGHELGTRRDTLLDLRILYSEYGETLKL